MSTLLTIILLTCFSTTISSTGNIQIINFGDSSSWYYAANINDVSTGNTITKFEILTTQNTWFACTHFTWAWTCSVDAAINIPLSIKLTAGSISITGHNIITSFTDKTIFDFGTNFANPADTTLNPADTTLNPADTTLNPSPTVHTNPIMLNNNTSIDTYYTKTSSNNQSYAEFIIVTVIGAAILTVICIFIILNYLYNKCKTVTSETNKKTNVIQRNDLSMRPGPKHVNLSGDSTHTNSTANSTDSLMTFNLAITDYVNTSSVTQLKKPIRQRYSIESYSTDKDISFRNKMNEDLNCIQITELANDIQKEIDCANTNMETQLPPLTEIENEVNSPSTDRCNTNKLYAE